MPRLFVFPKTVKQLLIFLLVAMLHTPHSLTMQKKSPRQSSAKPATGGFDIEKAKGKPMLQWVGKRPLEKVEYFPAQEKEVYGDKDAKEFNKLFWGDNLQVLSHLLKEYRGAVDVIYIDPPFDSKAEYAKKVKIRGQKLEGIQQSVLEEKQYSDIWDKDEYLQFMYERLLLARELLSDTGSIYVHVDWHKGSYLRLIMDEIFGEDNFQNEIIWSYIIGASGNERFGRKHQTIFFYSKSNKWTFNRDAIGVAYNPETIARARRGEARYQVDVEELEEKGKNPGDVWNDITPIQGNALEGVDYPTQKPEALLERIIKASSNEGDLVADFFIGSGTTAAVAQKLGRRWIGCDINIGAIQTTTKRLNQLISEQAKEKIKDFKESLGFKVLNVNEYDVFKNEVEAKEIVMETYGVEPIKRSYFDGVLDSDFVKVLPLNRVLGKMDIQSILKGISDEIDTFTKKTVSTHRESVYEEGVIVLRIDTLNRKLLENQWQKV
jgi:DNA modification methylase